MRLFVALSCPEEIRSKLVSVHKELSGVGLLRVVKEENIHLTLKFLGETSKQAMDELMDTLSVIESVRKFVVKVAGIGVFPTIKNPKVIWAGVEKGRDEIIRLQVCIESCLKELGYKKDDRFHPHYTLARIKRLDQKDQLKTLVKSKKREFGEYEVTNFQLIESTLGPRGPIYSVVEEFKLFD
ncbi:MAG: RNA 2',3'-cyclic phosphodiesterase [Candidatus Altiarchaeota archaeon]